MKICAATSRPALRVAVGEDAAPHADEQHGQELQAGRDAERGAAAVRELEDQPVLRDALHPRAGVGDHPPVANRR
jgi:hypothetical protein